MLRAIFGSSESNMRLRLKWLSLSGISCQAEACRRWKWWDEWNAMRILCFFFPYWDVYLIRGASFSWVWHIDGKWRLRCWILLLEFIICTHFGEWNRRNRRVCFPLLRRRHKIWSRNYFIAAAMLQSFRTSFGFLASFNTSTQTTARINI